MTSPTRIPAPAAGERGSTPETSSPVCTGDDVDPDARELLRRGVVEGVERLRRLVLRVGVAQARDRAGDRAVDQRAAAGRAVPVVLDVAQRLLDDRVMGVGDERVAQERRQLRWGALPTRCPGTARRATPSPISVLLRAPARMLAVSIYRSRPPARPGRAGRDRAGRIGRVFAMPAIISTTAPNGLPVHRISVPGTRAMTALVAFDAGRALRASAGERRRPLPRAPRLQGRRALRPLPRGQRDRRADGRDDQRLHEPRDRRLPRHLPRRGGAGGDRPADRHRGATADRPRRARPRARRGDPGDRARQRPARGRRRRC